MYYIEGKGISYGRKFAYNDILIRTERFTIENHSKEVTK